MIRSNQFENAILCFKQVKEQYCPRKMLNQIENTFKLMDEAKCEILGKIFNLKLNQVPNAPLHQANHIYLMLII